MQVCTDHFTLVYKLHVLITLNFHTCWGGYDKTQVANFRNCIYNSSTAPLKSLLTSANYDTANITINSKASQNNFGAKMNFSNLFLECEF